ncbi:MAG: hypothetical protein ACRC0S_02050 [Fusobacteriaceae bacterium]
MYNLEIPEKELKKMQLFFEETPKIMEKIIKQSLSRSATEIRKHDVREIKKKFHINGALLNPKSLLIKRSTGEVTLSASKQRMSIEEYYISLRKPSASKENIKAAVYRSTTPKGIKNMFWAFYKKDTSKIGLFKRKEGSKEIVKVKSPSIHSLSINLSRIGLYDDLQEIFNKNFSKTLEETINKS